MTHDFYRPISQAKLAAGLDDDGKLVGAARCAYPASRSTPSSIRRLVAGGRDERQLQGYYVQPGDAQLGYGAPNMLIEYAMRNTHVPVGPWRGVNTNQNAIYVECFIDEVAKAAGKDPLEFRRSLMARVSRSTWPCSTRRPRRRAGASRCRRACIAASPSSWATAAIRRRSPRSRSARKARSRCIAWCWRSIAATRSIPTRSPPRSRARSPSGSRRRSTASAPSRTAA